MNITHALGAGFRLVEDGTSATLQQEAFSHNGTGRHDPKQIWIDVWSGSMSMLRAVVLGSSASTSATRPTITDTDECNCVRPN